MAKPQYEVITWYSTTDTYERQKYNSPLPTVLLLAKRILQTDKKVSRLWIRGLNFGGIVMWDSAEAHLYPNWSWK